MMNEATTLLTGLPERAAGYLTAAAGYLATSCLAEEPEAYADETVESGLTALLNGEYFGGACLWWAERASGVVELGVTFDGGPFSNGPSFTFATVDRAGRFWVRGGDLAEVYGWCCEPGF